MNAQEKFDQHFIDYYKKTAIRMYSEEKKSIKDIELYLSAAGAKLREIEDIIEYLRSLSFQ